MSEFDERMGQLRARFLVRAEDERAQLVAACAAMNRNEIKRLSHGLSGSAGVFGFPAVSLDAQAVEEGVDENAGDAELRALCSTLIDSLARAAQED